MNWGSDELHHRSANRTGWCAELRAADPEEVDETVAGTVDYAAQTSPLSGDGQELAAGDLDTDSSDAEDRADSPDPADQPDGYVCALCGGDILDGEALDADGAPVDVGFQWVEDVVAYYRRCIEKGERPLPPVGSQRRSP